MRNWWWVVLMGACSECGTEPESKQPVKAVDAGIQQPVQARAPRLKAKVTKLERVTVAQPLRFRQRVEIVREGGKVVEAPDPGAIEASNALLVRVEFDRSPASLIGGAQDPIWFFNRVRPELVSVSRSDLTFTYVVPDPGAELASSVFWEYYPEEGVTVTPELVHSNLAEIARRKREPLVRLGDGKAPVVPVAAEPRQAKDLGELQRLVREEERKK